jgi:hypothetical protein
LEEKLVTVLTLNDRKQITKEFDLLGIRAEFLVRPKCHSLSILRSIMPARVAVPLHSHEDVEALYVTTGKLEIFCGSTNEWIDAKEGQFVHVPRERAPCIAQHVVRQRRHAAHYHGQDRFFDEISAPIFDDANRIMPSPERLQHFAEIAARYGYWLGSIQENAAIGITI